MSFKTTIELAGLPDLLMKAFAPLRFEVIQTGQLFAIAPWLFHTVHSLSF
jgi:hypothetical protein